MKHQLLEMLRCPKCKDDLRLLGEKEVSGEVQSGQLVCDGCAQSYSIINFVPRFVSVKNYASNFGFQWNQFRQTQLDSYSGHTISRERFFRQTGWVQDELTGKTLLDVGCGAGRFAEVALSCGANVVAMDYSAAVDACWSNLGLHTKLNIVQADMYQLPFKPGRFDYVYCFGVLQHTPDVRRAFMALPPQLKEKGRLAVDVYPKRASNILWPKYWLRLLTKHVPPKQLFGMVQAFVKALLPLSLAVGRIPFIGRKLRYAIPVVNYEGVYPLSTAQLQEWAILDTFDMLGAAHDHPQSAPMLAEWFSLAGLGDVEILRAGVLVGRGMK